MRPTSTHLTMGAGATSSVSLWSGNVAKPKTARTLIRELRRLITTDLPPWRDRVTTLNDF